MNYFREMVSEAGKLFVKPAASMTTGGFPRGKLMFRAQPFWQQLREDHIAGGGIEFKMGMDDGINFAKLKTKVEVEPDSSYAQSCVKVVSDSSCKGDTDAVSSVLREFVASNDTSQISYIFQSCFVTQKAASASVCEACKLNQIEALKLLLKAGSLPTSKLSGKPALHFAVENGSEDAALMLITSELNAEEVCCFFYSSQLVVSSSISFG